MSSTQDPLPSKNKCSYCRQYGHNIRTCVSKKNNRRIIREAPYPLNTREEQPSIRMSLTITPRVDPVEKEPRNLGMPEQAKKTYEVIEGKMVVTTTAATLNLAGDSVENVGTSSVQKEVDFIDLETTPITTKPKLLDISDECPILSIPEDTKNITKPYWDVIAEQVKILNELLDKFCK